MGYALLTEKPPLGKNFRHRRSRRVKRPVSPWMCRGSTISALRSASGPRVHMNGRVYDPDLGRFISADPYVQYPMISQNYNRYTYVDNNPLSYTDPSGFFMFGQYYGDAYDNFTDSGSYNLDFNSSMGFFAGESYSSLDYSATFGFEGDNISVTGYEGGSSFTYYFDTASYLGGSFSETVASTPTLDSSPTGLLTDGIGVNGDSFNPQGFLNWLLNTAGFTATADALSKVNNGQWLGKNGKWYPLKGHQPNGWTGSRAAVVQTANFAEAAGRRIFFIGATVSVVEGASAALDGDIAVGVGGASADVAMGALATFGGWGGLAAGATYFVIDATVGIESATGPITDFACSATGDC